MFTIVANRHVFWNLSLAILVSVLIFVMSESIAQDTLQGSVTRERTLQSNMYEGTVQDFQTGKPLAGAEVTIPEHGFKTMTDNDGSFQIPRSVGRSPMILGIEKQGYTPFSLTITDNGAQKFSVRLRKQQDFIVLDSQLHHLGDGSFAAVSSAAGLFKKPPDGPAIRIPFTLQGYQVTNTPYLLIGSIIGIDTQMAHFISGNPMKANASPLLVKLNGQVIAQIAVSGDQKKIQLPLKLLNRNGLNTLELETGFHYPEPGRIDYDDIELMHVLVHP